MTDTENRTLSDKFMLRLPDGMRDRIKAAAEAANRSMNAEIVATLEEKYPAPPNFLESLEGMLDTGRKLYRSLCEAPVELRPGIVAKLNKTAAEQGIDATYRAEADGFTLVTDGMTFTFKLSDTPTDD